MLNKNYKTKKIFFLFSLLGTLLYLSTLNISCTNHQNETKIISLNSSDIASSPLIFIGGYARSGSNLMRSILNVHPDVSCGPESEVLTIMTKFIYDYVSTPNIVKSLNKAGIQKENVNTALAIFIHQILANPNGYAKHICAKDTKLLYFMEYLAHILPKAKFLYMVRDGRDVAWSMIKNKSDNLMAKFENFLSLWNLNNADLNEKCKRIGVDRCLLVKYEDLVLNATTTLAKVTDFLNIEWRDDFLNPQWRISENSINKWVGSINVGEYYAPKISSMLKEFGYDMSSYKNSI